MRIPPCAALIALCLAWPGAARAQQAARPLLGDSNDGSRARPVHVIPLRDADGEIIRPGDRTVMPFSPARTCGADCHDVQKVSHGWHFNAALPGIPGGRPGQPWILVEADVATEVAVSSRRWPGTFTPDQLGLSTWNFAKRFGGRTPGLPFDEAADRGARWMVSGGLEVNCLACHDAAAAFDQAEYGRQVALENFRWAATAASGIAQVTGAAREMPDTFDFMLPAVEDGVLARMPRVAYAPAQFLPDAKVAFDVARRVPANRCYFCHSSADATGRGAGRWKADEDVHLARGMTCVDCHRNGLDHLMTRGYEGEPAAANDPDAATLSCRGCHYGPGADRGYTVGRLGAPYPRHAGIPPVHFTRLTCTACHSGPRPEATARRVTTSQAHGLGGRTIGKSAEARPHLYYPVFAEQADRRIAPHRLMWPSFWARREGAGVLPIPPDKVRAVFAKARLNLTPPTEAGPGPSDEQIARGLELLDADRGKQGEAVYIAGGKVYRVGRGRQLTGEDHPAARPYVWPIAHDVRPASLALGARGCEDCHSTGAPLTFGRVPVDSPLASRRDEPWVMTRFQEHVDPARVEALARSFKYRPWLKAAELAAVAVIGLVLLAYAVLAVRRVSRIAGGGRG